MSVFAHLTFSVAVMVSEIPVVIREMITLLKSVLVGDRCCLCDETL